MGAVDLHRVLRTTPERLFTAFTDPDAMAKWLPPYGFTCKVFETDATVGGAVRMAFTNVSTGNGHAFGGKYLELEPGKHLRYTDVFEDSNLRTSGPPASQRPVPPPPPPDGPTEPLTSMPVAP